MAFDYNKLRGRIREMFKTESAFAKEVGISPAMMSLRMTGKVMFSQEEIAKCCDLLQIGAGDIKDFFFTVRVKET